jgi:hypothetical protein
MSHPAPRIWLDRGNITRADIEKCSPPPTWTAESERQFARAWARRHTSNPEAKDIQEAWVARAKREAQAMTTAQEWADYFGIPVNPTSTEKPRLNAEQAAAYYRVVGKKAEGE